MGIPIVRLKIHVDVEVDTLVDDNWTGNPGIRNPESGIRIHKSKKII